MQASIQSPSALHLIKASICSAGLMLITVAPASAQGFPLPGMGGPGAAGAGAPSNDLPVNLKASRFVGPEEMAEYLQGYNSKFSILTRKADPFGQVQDPTSPPPVVKATVANRTPRSYKPTAFADIIGRIKIKAIMPSSKTFMTGNRSFKEGDRFPLRYRGKDIQVEVASVSARKVDFKKVSTGELASVKLGLLPAGMNAGSNKFSAPGMVSDKDDAPLQVDPLSGF